MLALASVLALAALSVTSAADCARDGPRAWLSDIVSFDPNHRVYRNQSSDYYVRAHFAYDEDALAKRTIEFAAVANDKPELLDILELFAERKAYVVDIKTKACKVFDIRDEFIPSTPPPFAKFGGYTTIGTAGLDSIDLAQFEARDEKRGLAYYQTVTARDCIPVRNDFLSEETGFHYEEHSNVVLGIPDRTIFDVPEVCRK